MRIGTHETIYVVTDPTPFSELADIFSRTTPAGLAQLFRGGLTAKMNPTLFTDAEEAEREARGRLLAVRVARELLASGRGHEAAEASRVRLTDAAGQVVLDVELPR